MLLRPRYLWRPWWPLRVATVTAVVVVGGDRGEGGLAKAAVAVVVAATMCAVRIKHSEKNTELAGRVLQSELSYWILFSG